MGEHGDSGRYLYMRINHQERPRLRLRFSRILSDSPFDDRDRNSRRGPDQVAASKMSNLTGDERRVLRRNSNSDREGRSATFALDSTYSK